MVNLETFNVEVIRAEARIMMDVVEALLQEDVREDVSANMLAIIIRHGRERIAIDSRGYIFSRYIERKISIRKQLAEEANRLLGIM